MAGKFPLKPGTHFVMLVQPSREMESEWKVLEVIAPDENHIAMTSRVVAGFRFGRDAQDFAAKKNQNQD